MMKPVFFLLPLVALLSSAGAQSIVYVTQVPPLVNAGTVTSVGNNHLPSVKAAPRGGDLMVRYNEGTLRNLTKEAALGATGQDQGTGAIAVRDPHVHWTGQRILFSMVVNSANPSADRWQIYEAVGVLQGASVRITKVANQPSQFNNVQPCYAPDDRIIYVSDRTLDGGLSSYPAVDEKGQGQINTGLWSLDPGTGDLIHLDHSPSGSFDPFVDSYGRVLFTRWDHLQRDEKAVTGGGFDYTSETSSTVQPGQATELFPEPLADMGVERSHHFDLFMPWTVNPDGTELLTLNHVGRHEFSPSALRSRTDTNLTDMLVPTGSPQSSSPVRAASLMQLTEHPTTRGRIFGTDASVVGLSAGRIVSIPATSPTTNPASMTIKLVVSGNGVMRDPVVLSGSNNKLVASVADGPNVSTSSYGGSPGGAALPPVDGTMMLAVNNPFKIRISGAPVPPSTLNSLITLPSVVTEPAIVTVVNYDNGQPQSFTGPLWQLQPVELRPTSRPTVTVPKMEGPERDAFITAGVSPLALKSWLRSRDLAMMTVRNVTQRDGADHQQPTNLEVVGGVRSVKADGGPTYKVKGLQMVQGEYLRGYTNGGALTGRRIKATTVKPLPGITQTPAGLPEGSVSVSTDGSAAALVPAGRATSWQLLDHGGLPVVRERYWLSFQAGEVRACTSCHGVNSIDQLGNMSATNTPAALRTLLETVKQTAPEVSSENTFRTWSEASFGMALNPNEDADLDGTSNMLEWGMGTNPMNVADKPAMPLTVTLFEISNEKFASVSFTHSLTETRAATLLEASSDLSTWRTVVSFSNVVTTDSSYSLSRVTMSGGKSEVLTLTSSIPVTQTEDRFYRVRVSAN